MADHVLQVRKCSPLQASLPIDARVADPAQLMRAHVVVTSYSIVSSEHGVYAADAKDETKGKSKSKSKKQTLDSSDDDDASGSRSDSDSSAVGKTLKTKARAAPRKKAAKDALFRVKWWRIVLGKPGTCDPASKC